MVDLREKTRLCSVCYKMCRDVCSVAGATRHEADSPHNRGFFAQQIIEGKERLNAEVVDYFYRCSMCKACREACEGGMDTSEIMLNARRELDGDLLPQAVRSARERITSGAYYGKDSPPVRKLIARHKPGLNGGTLFYFGARLRTSNGDTIRSTLSIMERLGMDFTTMEDEPSTGQIAYYLGFTADARKLGERFSRSVRGARPKMLVVFSADDLRMIKKEYPSLGIEIPGVDIVGLPEFLLKILSEKRPPFPDWQGGIVTYHDPCSLGRELRVFEPPREIITSAVKGQFSEMALIRDQAPCCGWGMGLEIAHPEIAGLMARRLALMARDAGASVLVTGCPSCREVILEGIKKNDDPATPVEILDLPIFLERALR